jgi:hypothetical protein
VPLIPGKPAGGSFFPPPPPCPTPTLTPLPPALLQASSHKKARRERQIEKQGDTTERDSDQKERYYRERPTEKQKFKQGIQTKRNRHRQRNRQKIYTEKYRKRDTDREIRTVRCIQLEGAEKHKQRNTNIKRRMEKYRPRDTDWEI